MFNHSLFNLTLFNRSATTAQDSLRANAIAIATAISTAYLKSYMAGEAHGDSSSILYIVLKTPFSGKVNGMGNSMVIPVCIFKLAGFANGETTSTGGNLMAVGTAMLDMPNISLNAGDEIIIDTERMTITVNSVNNVYQLSNVSEFFDIKLGDMITVGDTGSARVTLLWKDRWL